MNHAEENTVKLRELFQQTSNDVNLRGIIGVTSFKKVYISLIDVQQTRMHEIVGTKLNRLLEVGKIISIAYVYPDGIIDNIGVLKDGVLDKEAWNIYADWYAYLNNSLDNTAKKIVDVFSGIDLPLKLIDVSRVNHVSQFFPTAVSHRVHAEHAGIGWRGKNSLIVNPYYSCMIRLSGVITEAPLVDTSRLQMDCGGCTSCEEACSYLENRDKLDDYREQCRVYLDSLGLNEEVCGKCIKACVYSPRMVNMSVGSKSQELNQVYYT